LTVLVAAIFLGPWPVTVIILALIIFTGSMLTVFLAPDDHDNSI
jgi:hypothetical protein